VISSATAKVYGADPDDPACRPALAIDADAVTVTRRAPFWRLALVRTRSYPRAGGEGCFLYSDHDVDRRRRRGRAESRGDRHERGPRPHCRLLARANGAAVMSLAPWLVAALIAWFMWWYWQRQNRK